MLYRMLIIDRYSYLYSYSSTSTRTRTCTHVKIKYSDSYSHILQVLVPVLVLVNLVLAPALIDGSYYKSPLIPGGPFTVRLTSQWVRWRLKSPASPLFAQPYIQTRDHRKHQGSVSLAFVRGIHRWPPHKWPVTRKFFPFDDVIMLTWFTFNPRMDKYSHV